MSLLRRAGRAALSQFESLVEQLEKSATKEVFAERVRNVRSDARRELLRVVAAKRRSETERQRAEEQVELWAHRAELAVRGGDEELARHALRRKRAAQQEVEQLARLGSELAAEAQGMKGDLQRLEARATAGFQQPQPVSPERLGSAAGQPSAVEEWQAMEQRLDDVELVLEAEKEVEAALSSGSSGRYSAWELEARFRELEGSSEAALEGASEIDRELSDLRQKFRV